MKQQRPTIHAGLCNVRKGAGRPTANKRRCILTGLSITLVAFFFSRSIYLISIVHLWKEFQQSEEVSSTLTVSLPLAVSPIIVSLPSTSASASTADKKSTNRNVNTLPKRIMKTRIRYRTLPKSETDQLPTQQPTGISSSNNGTNVVVSGSTGSLSPSPTELKFLETKLLNNSKIYNTGSWDGAGIVIPEYRLVFFTQGKVRNKIHIRVPLTVVLVK
jgi:hypothetical protein